MTCSTTLPGLRAGFFPSSWCQGSAGAKRKQKIGRTWTKNANTATASNQEPYSLLLQRHARLLLGCRRCGAITRDNKGTHTLRPSSGFGIHVCLTQPHTASLSPPLCKNHLFI